jgi:hypothetical protein
VGWTFAAGVALMLAIEKVVKRFNHGGEHARERGLLARAARADRRGPTA